MWETAEQFGAFVTFQLKDDVNLVEPSEIQSINAFELMRIASEFNASRNSFDQLHIDLCEWIKTNGGGWIGRDNANTMEKNLSQIYQNLWYIDNCF